MAGPDPLAGVAAGFLISLARFWTTLPFFPVWPGRARLARCLVSGARTFPAALPCRLPSLISSPESSAAAATAAAALRYRPWSLGGKGVIVYPPALASLPPGTHSGPGLPQAKRQNLNWIEMAKFSINPDIFYNFGAENSTSG